MNNMPNGVSGANVLTALFIAITVLMITAMPSALADPDPSPGGSPNPSVRDSILTMSVVSGASTFMDELIVYDTPTPPADTGSCPLVIPAGIKAWRLVASSDGTTPIRAFIPPLANPFNQRIEVPFGTGVGSPVTVQAFGGATLTDNGGLPPTTPGTTSVSATWLSVGTVAGAPTTHRVGDYRIGVCGKENNLVYASASPMDVSTPFTISNPVGGEIIPVSTTALLLAGVSTSAMWLIPLAVIAASTFAVLRFQVYRK